MSADKPNTFAEFWPYYVRAHSKTATQVSHLFGTLTGAAFAAYCLVAANWLWLPLALVIGYGCAWLSHFLIEGNRPATFGHPFYSFLADFKMAGYVLTGRMRAEVERCRELGDC